MMIMQVVVDTFGSGRISDSFSLKQTLGLVAALLGVVVLVFWVVVILHTRGTKSRKHRHHRHHHHHRRSAEPAMPVPAPDEAAAETAPAHRPHRHHHRREHWSRNPTLAETGGLPPKRSDLPPPPTPSQAA